jgi:hypothetical protein
VVLFAMVFNHQLVFGLWVVRSCSFSGEVLLYRVHRAAIRFMTRKAKAKFVSLSEVIASMGRLCTKRHGLHGMRI